MKVSTFLYTCYVLMLVVC